MLLSKLNSESAEKNSHRKLGLGHFPHSFQDQQLDVRALLIKFSAERSPMENYIVSNVKFPVARGRLPVIGGKFSFPASVLNLNLKSTEQV